MFVILNISMPKLNGFQAAREIKMHVPESAIVILSILRTGKPPITSIMPLIYHSTWQCVTGGSYTNWGSVALAGSAVLENGPKCAIL
jgi:hypothetical protein